MFMSKLITVNDVQVEQIVYKGQPVVTFEMIAQVHGVDVENVRQAFKRHRERFTEGKHFYRIDFQEASQLVLRVPVSPNGMAIFTEKGYLLLVKPMRDDTSWQVQERMIDDYFALRAQLPLPIAPLVAPQLTPKEQLQESIDCAKLAMEFLAEIGQLNQRDRLMFADTIRTAHARIQQPTSSPHLALPSPEHFDIADRCRALGYRLNRRQEAEIFPVLGRRVAKEYRERHADDPRGSEPHEIDRFVDGKIRPVKWYLLSDAEWIDTIIQSVMASHGINL
jgi:hypothetical protein